jgi:hypothetical protein
VRRLVSGLLLAVGQRDVRHHFAMMLLDAPASRWLEVAVGNRAVVENVEALHQLVNQYLRHVLQEPPEDAVQPHPDGEQVRVLLPIWMWPCLIQTRA